MKFHDLFENAGGGAVSASGIAAFPGRMQLGMNTRNISPLSQKIKRSPLQGINTFKWKYIDSSKKSHIMNKLSFKQFNSKHLEESEGPAGSYYDEQDVISKLKDAEKQAEHRDNTTGFVLEDEEGGIVKVYVKNEEAQNFETSLAAMMNDSANSDAEIAEILFELRKKFTIVDVEWPTIEEDEEEIDPETDSESELDVNMGDEGEGSSDNEMTADDQLDDGSLDDSTGDADALSALDKIIQMMTADAEAKKAEAEARKAEADAESAKYASQAAEQKIKDHEEILDMEAHEQREKDEKKEAEQIAKLARYRHDLKNNPEKYDEGVKPSLKQFLSENN